MVHAGLLVHRRVLHARSGVYIATRDGLDLGGCERMRPCRISFGTYEHTVALPYLVIALEEEFGAQHVLAERELRLGTSEDRDAFQISVASERRGSHWPDAIVLGAIDGKPLAIELERTVKRTGRLDAILRGYVRARSIGGVRYYAATLAARAAVERSVRRIKAPSGLIEVRGWASGEGAIDCRDWDSADVIPFPGRTTDGGRRAA
ncbi:MAG: hypothetical protein WBD55_07190 [Dehalococcoidia bacterium]